MLSSNTNLSPVAETVDRPTSRRVQWYGAHPAEGSISMGVYRMNLLRALSEDGRYDVRCWPIGEALTRGGGRTARAWGKYVAYPLRVSLGRWADVVHILDHSSGHLLDNVPNSSRTVVTLFDLIPLRYAGSVKARQVARYRRIVAHLGKADAVVSASEYSKREAIRLLGLDPERIHVVPLGVAGPTTSSPSAAAGRLRAAGSEVLVLSVGSALERKNLELLPTSLAAARRESGVSIGLLRVGSPLSKRLASAVTAVLGEGRLVEAGRLDEPELWAAYRDVDVVFVPSLYEGFGLPVLEGFAVGKPVACSNATSLPDVGGDLAEYFDPLDGEAAGRALVRCMEQTGDPDVRVRRLQRARKFTWSRHLTGLFEVYDRLLGETV